MAQGAPPERDMGYIDDVIDRMIGEAANVSSTLHLEADAPPPKPKRRRTRKPSLISVAKQAAKAGLEVARYEVDTDGKISVVTGKPEIASNDTPNEWDRLQ